MLPLGSVTTYMVGYYNVRCVPVMVIHTLLCGCLTRTSGVVISIIFMFYGLFGIISL